jgi:hypothetical protein
MPMVNAMVQYCCTFANYGSGPLATLGIRGERIGILLERPKATSDVADFKLVNQLFAVDANLTGFSAPV